jgi:beta-lactamase regulating signal transducer with metallopeptidase domain
MVKARPYISKILAVLLWLGTLVGGLLDIYVSQFITISVYARFFLGSQAVASQYADVANSLRIATILIMGLLYIAFVIATSEYHFKHLDEPSSWRLLGQTVVIELLIIVIAYFMGPVTL